MNKAVSLKNGQEKNLFLCALRGFAVAVITALILAVITCLIGLSMDDPDKYTKIFALASLFVASFAGGFAAAKEKGSGTLLCGLCTGLMVIGAMVLASLGFALSLNMLLFGICAPTVLVLCILGANVGVGAGNTKSRQCRHPLGSRTKKQFKN